MGGAPAPIRVQIGLCKIRNVIASEAKQSKVESAAPMDCFVATLLATTFHMFG
jgi:hypothetical protein